MCVCVWADAINCCSLQLRECVPQLEKGKTSSWSFRLASNNWKSWLYVALESQEKRKSEEKRMRMRMRTRIRIQYPLRCSSARILFVSFHWLSASHRGREHSRLSRWTRCAACRITISNMSPFDFWLSARELNDAVKEPAKRLFSSGNQAKWLETEKGA